MLSVTRNMIAIILAGGYAKRLWPLTLERPKALLPVGGRPIIDHVVEKLVQLEPAPSKIILSTNLKFLSTFEEWLKKSRYDTVEIVPEESRDEGEKLGAVKALAEIVEKVDREDSLVLAGDSVFTDRLEGLVHFFHEKNSAVIALYHAKSLAEVERGSSVKIDETKRILEFVEKPSHPRSTLVGACLYAFPAGMSRRFREYLSIARTTDEPGRFIEWLHTREPVYGYLLNDYLWDIGTVDSYKAATEFFTRKKQLSRIRALYTARKWTISNIRNHL
jgi:glucose-1-phosphate thymidylyltransferase